jgi:hypothetical protein
MSTAVTRRSGSPVTAEELATITGRDGDDAVNEATPSEQVAQAPASSNGVLTRVAQFYAGRSLSKGAWGTLLGPEFESSIAAAVGRRELSDTFKTGVGLLGVDAAAVAAWAEKHGVHPAETPASKILSSIRFDEAFPIVEGKDCVTTAATAAKHLGIDEGAILAAIKSGDIGNEGGKAFATKWRIDYAALKAWLEKTGTKPQWHPDIVARVAHERGLVADNERSRLEAESLAAGEPLSAVDVVLTRLADYRATEAKEEEAERQQLLTLYRKILRRAEPVDDDLAALNEIMQQFGWSAERVRNDVEIVKQATACEVRLSDVEKKNSELLAAVKAEGELKKRHKQEFIDAAKRTTEAREKCNDIRKAATELDDLRRLRPEIFGV